MSGRQVRAVSYQGQLLTMTSFGCSNDTGGTGTNGECEVAAQAIPKSGDGGRAPACTCVALHRTNATLPRHPVVDGIE
jgi:hypothetical protein